MAGTSPAMTMEPSAFFKEGPPQFHLASKLSSSFLLTRYLPLYSCGCLPTLSM
jgi:hypothetical protein